MAKKRTGRPYAEINWDTVENLCAIHCTGEEIAAILKVDYDTLERAIRREFNSSFADYFKKHSSKGKMSLRRKQYEVAQSGSVPMLIWLGKQYLGQADKVENHVEPDGEITINVRRVGKDAD